MVLKVVGKNSSGVEKGEGVIMLPENPAVKVTVVSGLAYTKGGKKDMLINLYRTKYASNNRCLIWQC